MQWNSDNTISVEQTKRPKKLTGTRLGAVLGRNKWKTDFEVWCDMTHTYERPFEETVYTLCGKVIEDRQCKFLKRSYFFDRVAKPEDNDYYGRNFLDKTHGDFYPEQKRFGGMWDGLILDGKTPIGVVECKTTKRAEDWLDENGQIVVPEYYALQGSLYAYLLGLDDVYMIVSVLDDFTYNQAQSLLDDYGVDRVEAMIKNGTIKDLISFEPKADNTSVIHFKVSEKYPDFLDLLDQANEWYDEHILTGVSPRYDEKLDADILKELRKNHLTPDTDLNELLKEYEEVDNYLNDYYSKVADKEERLKNLKGQITELLKRELDENLKQVEVETDNSTFVLTKSERKSVDSKKLEQDGLLEEYQITAESFTLKRKENKED